MAAAVSEYGGVPLSVLRAQLDVVLPQIVRVPVPVHLDPRDAAALPVRPVDAARVEGTDAAGDREPGDHRDCPSVDAVMAEALAFYTLAAFILGFGVLVVTTKNTVHSVLFLVLNFLSVAALYVLPRAPFLAVIQVLVYAGGIVVLYLFVVMLVNLKRPPEAHSDPHRMTRVGVGLAGGVLVEVVAIGIYNYV